MGVLYVTRSYDMESTGFIDSLFKLSASEWSEPSFGRGLPLFLDPDVVELPQLANTEPTTEALRMLVDHKSVIGDAEYYRKMPYPHMEDIITGMRDEELADHLMQWTGPSKLEQIFLFIRYFVYMSSNNLFDEMEADILVRRMVESKTEWVLDLLLELRTPTTEIFGSNILVSAAEQGEYEIVLRLVAKGVDVNASAYEDYPRTALAAAIDCRQPRIVELLLNAGADPKTRLYREHQLLLDTLRDGPEGLEMLRMLFNKGADVSAIKYNTDFHYPLLPNAVMDADMDVIQFLLAAGANIEAFDQKCGTALQVAVAGENIEVIQLLINAGADINAPAEALVDMDRGNPESYLLGAPIGIASLVGNAEIVKILVNEGADVDAFQWDCDGDPDPGPWEECRRYQWKNQETLEDDMTYAKMIMTPLQAAVFKRDPLIVQILLDAGASVDEKRYGDTPLQIAAALDETRIVHLLQKHGADVNSNAAYEGGKTALQAAARANNYEMVRILLDSGAEVNAAASPHGGRTALQATAETGNVDLAKVLIEAGADVNADASPRNGRTCLQAAAEYKHVEMVRMLLDIDADVNGSEATISGGLTALQAALYLSPDDDEESGIHYDGGEQVAWSTQQRRDKILQALFDTNADISAQSSPQEGMTTILLAVKTGRPELVRWCLQGGADPNISTDDMTAPGASVYQGSAELVSLLIESGADVNARCEMYNSKLEPLNLPLWTALHVAATTGMIDIANLLIEAGAKVNVPLRSPDSCTVLQSAVASNSIRMVQFLLDKGAAFHECGTPSRPMPNMYSFVSMEVLNVLAVAGEDLSSILCAHELALDEEDMQKLLYSGALMHWTAEQKGLLLQAAIREGYSDLIKEMLVAGADVNTPAANFTGRTALQMAARRGCTGMVTLLLSHGADVNAPAGYRRGITALQGAAINGSLKTTLILLRAGAEVNAAAAVEEGRTALQAAAEHGRLDIVCLLLENDHNKEGMGLRCEHAGRLAESEGHKVIARILREHGTDQGMTE